MHVSGTLESCLSSFFDRLHHSITHEAVVKGLVHALQGHDLPRCLQQALCTGFRVQVSKCSKHGAIVRPCNVHVNGCPNVNTLAKITLGNDFVPHWDLMLTAGKPFTLS